MGWQRFCKAYKLQVQLLSTPQQLGIERNKFMRIIFLGTTKAFIKVSENEDYPEHIPVFVDKKRIFHKYICCECNKVFYAKKQQDFCSQECFSNSKSFMAKCYNCGKDFKTLKSRVLHSKSGLFFCSRECKDFAQSIEGGCEAIRPIEYKTGITYYREKAIKNKPMECEECGIKESDILEVHHKDGNRKNNNLSNLIILCPNCHARHTKKKQKHTPL